jgi:hypothetical protein
MPLRFARPARRRVSFTDSVFVHGGEVIHPTTVPDDPAESHGIAVLARECLQQSPFTTLRRVSCKCRQGVLFLTGRLSSFYQKQVAQEAVAAVRGVSRVVNDIEVHRPD